MLSQKGTDGTAASTASAQNIQIRPGVTVLFTRDSVRWLCKRGKRADRKRTNDTTTKRASDKGKSCGKKTSGDKIDTGTRQGRPRTRKPRWRASTFAANSRMGPRRWFLKFADVAPSADSLIIADVVTMGRGQYILDQFLCPEVSLTTSPRRAKVRPFRQKKKKSRDNYAVPCKTRRTPRADVLNEGLPPSSCNFEVRARIWKKFVVALQHTVER